MIVCCLCWIVSLAGFCLIYSPTYAQDVFWGLATHKGPIGFGTAFSLKGDGTSFTVHHVFDYDASSPFASLIEGSNGYLYGTTSSGGEYSNGTIFRLAANGTNFTILKSLNNETEGAFPVGSLIEGSDGYLYGLTSSGGDNGMGSGTIFRLAADGSDFTILKTFYGTEGGTPWGHLIQGKDGFLYGLTAYGGNNGNGTLFKISPDGSGFVVLKYFNYSTDGANPRGSLIEGNDGYLYGLTSKGGDHDSGTIFKIGTDGFGFTVLRSFHRFSDGADPNGSLTQGSDGYLYGLTQNGGTNGLNAGTIFKMTPDGTNFTVLRSFNASTDGANPNGDLTEGSDGFFYGMTQLGGNQGDYGDIFGNGTIFKIAPDGGNFTVLKHFSTSPTSDGGNPLGSLLLQKKQQPPLPAPIQVNFQNKWATPPPGWLKDYGLPFGEKAVADCSLTFGWKNLSTGEPIDLSVGGTFPGNSGNGRHRPAPADVLLATFIHMQGNHVKNFRGTPVESYWEMAVPNGNYLFTVSVGDGAVYTYSDPEFHSIQVEGVTPINQFKPEGPQGSITRFRQATVNITVTDGYVTISANVGKNTKINYAIIQPLAADTSKPIARRAVFSPEPATKQSVRIYPNPFSDKLNIDVAGQQERLSLTIIDVLGKSYYQTVEKTIGQSIVLDLSAAPLPAGIYLIKLQSENGFSKVVRLVKRQSL